MSIEEQLCKVENTSTPIYVYSTRCINQRFELKNYGISCLALMFNMSNPRTTILHAKKQLQVARGNKLYTVFFEKSIWTCSSAFKVCSNESSDLGSILTRWAVLNSKFSVSTSLRLMSCSTNIESRKNSNPIYVQCNKMYQLKVCSLSSLDFQLQQSENTNPAGKKIV